MKERRKNGARSAAAVAAALVGLASPAASAWDDTLNIDTMPDLYGFLRRQPVMGECPLGLRDAEGDATPPGRHLLHLGTTGFYLDYRIRLKLSDDQIASLKAIRDAVLREAAAREVEIRQAEERMWTLTSTVAPEPSGLKAQVDAIGAVRDQQRWLHLEAVLEASRVLTDAQRSKLSK
jgi:hypothetical protein